MKNKSMEFIWSIAWWLENDKAWFIDGMANTLFCADLNTGECEQVSKSPDLDECIYRLTPYCMKCGRDILFIPGYGKSIWIYNLDNDTFTALEIDKPDHHHLASNFWRFEDSIYIVAGDWNKVIEVNTSQKIIANYYSLCSNDSVRRSVLVGSKIYAVSAEFGKVYQFDINTKKVDTYMLPNFEKKLFTICFDGQKFWMSGYQKEVYIWDIERNSITIINKFPENFGSDNADEEGNNLHIFNFAVFAGGYIWFIPTREGKIMYADKKTAELFVFEIYDEEKTNILSRKYGIAEYLLEYVRDERYIGLFSTRNRRIFEIDAEQLSYQWMEYHFSQKCLEQHFDNCKGIFYEREDNLLQTQAYNLRMQGTTSKSNDVVINSVGMKIYEKIVKEEM